MKMDDKILILISFVKQSQYRQKALLSIGDTFKFPQDIAAESNIKLPNISKTLQQLKSKKLIECVNEEVSKGRIYRATPLGLEVLENMDVL